MVKLENFLNKRYSLRNISDEEFEKIVPILAEQLEKYDYTIIHSDNVLKKDWNNLLKWKSETNELNSVSRIGMKICDHFFPNFYNIENNLGKSFSNCWTKTNLEKCLRWNRKSHSTPYLSEIKRGIYFCCGLTKSTMYRPQLSKLLCMKYSPTNVFDPCAGWGGRMLGAVASGANYIAFEPNTETFYNLQKIINFLNIEKQVKIICDDAMNMDYYDFPNYDMIITSPPYFDVEIYSKEKTQSITKLNDYDSWKDYFLKGIIEKSITRLNEDGVSCWNVGKVGKKDMRKDVIEIHKQFDYSYQTSFAITSSKRQALQNKEKNQKSKDLTDIFKK